jgi:ATP-dependent DNA helicase RecG
MLTFDELWKRLCELDESVQIEAKTGEQVGPSILETISAFSNEPGRSGGYLLLGVKSLEDGLFANYEIVGVPDASQVEADLATKCCDQFNTPIRPTIWVEFRDGKRIVVAFIPEADAADKPIYIKSRGMHKGAYRRIGSTDQRCTDDDIHVLYQGRGTKPLEESIITDGDLSDFDPAALLAYRNARERANKDAPELKYSDEDLLYALGAISRLNGIARPTLAGIILFGKQPSIRRHYPAMRVDYIRVQGREWVKSPDERFDSVDMLGPLLITIPRAITAVLDDIPKSFRLPANSFQREDVPLVPQTALREAIVNAVMHRSYRLNQPIQIIRYSNRLEVRNPGVSLVPDDRLGDPGSQQRNPRIAAVLHDTGFAETKGSGIRAIREAMQQANLSLPTFESDRDKDSFVVTFLFHHFLSKDDVEWLGNFQHLGLTEDEQRALVYVREVGAINNAAYRDLNRVETLVASSHLRRLRDASLLEQHGKGSATFYKPTARLMEPTSSGAAGITQELNPSGLPVSEGLSPSDLPIPEGLATAQQALPEPLRRAVEGLGKRTQPDRLREVIVQLCTWKPQSADQLAEILRRNKHYIATHVLSGMLQDGLLAYVHPEQPAHPQQAYTVPPKKPLAGY